MLTALVVLVLVIFVDILLSGDNAVVIAMAANTLIPSQRTPAIIYGMTLAAVTRIILSLFAVSLLHYRIVSIIGGISLFWVAYKLGKDIYTKGNKETKVRQSTNLLSTIGVIAVADISMSLDNVLAVASIARNNPIILVLGLIISIACLGFGAKLLAGLMERWTWATWAGVALIGMIAFELVLGFDKL